MRKQIIIILIIALTQTSCIYTEEIMETSELNLRLQTIEDCSNVQINIENGEAKKSNNCIFQLKFNKARGGKTILFGKVLKDSSPEITNDVIVLINNKEIIRTNYNRLLKLSNQRINGELIYNLAVE